MWCLTHLQSATKIVETLCPKAPFWRFGDFKNRKWSFPFPSLPLPHPLPTMLCSCRGQKCWELSSDFIKTGELPLPHQTTFNFERNGWKWVLLGGTTLLGDAVRGTTNQKHYPDLGRAVSSVWNFCAHFSDVIWRGNQWWRQQMSAVFSGQDVKFAWGCVRLTLFNTKSGNFAKERNF